jgi:hypothetical protein
MSRLMNVAGDVDAASSYSGASVSTAWATASSNAHGVCGATTADTFTEM